MHYLGLMNAISNLIFFLSAPDEKTPSVQEGAPPGFTAQGCHHQSFHPYTADAKKSHNEKLSSSFAFPSVKGHKQNKRMN